jgi:hypothetical protein
LTLKYGKAKIISMIFGNKNIYAIEVYHEPLDDTILLTGRLSLHLYSKTFGDINDEYCDLSQPYEFLLDKIKHLDKLEYEFGLNNDNDIFKFLDNKLYMDEERTMEQIKNDTNFYFKFCFLTNAGEMFDRTKSFIYMDKEKIIHILYQIDDNQIICVKIDNEIFKKTTSDFIEWYEEKYKEEGINEPPQGKPCGILSVALV